MHYGYPDHSHFSHGREDYTPYREDQWQTVRHRGRHQQYGQGRQHSYQGRGRDYHQDTTLQNQAPRFQEN